MNCAVAPMTADQLCAVRPLLNRPSDRVLAGGAVARSATHRAYIALEAAAARILLLPD